MPKVNENTLRLPLDETRRELIINALADVQVDNFADCGGIRDAVLFGHKGLNDYTDEELVEEYKDSFNDSPYVGEYYHELDEESNLWCVFNTETIKAYASYSSEVEAKGEADKLNLELNKDLQSLL